MNKIKFSHYYDKLYQVPPITQAKLLEAIQVRLEDLSPVFLAYDTDNGKYKLPVQGLYIMLIFEKKNSNIFTTIRRFTPQKYEYYQSKRGKIFGVEIEGGDKVGVNVTEFAGGHRLKCKMCDEPDLLEGEHGRTNQSVSTGCRGSYIPCGNILDSFDYRREGEAW